MIVQEILERLMQKITIVKTEVHERSQHGVLTKVRPHVSMGGHVEKRNRKLVPLKLSMLFRPL